MPIPDDYSFTRYLAAKKSVDDRALNPHVWRAFADALRGYATMAPPKVLEIGSGIGTMVERVLQIVGLDSGLDYFAIDTSPETTTEAAGRISAIRQGRVVRVDDQSTPGSPRYRLTIARPDAQIPESSPVRLNLLTADFFDFAGRTDIPLFDFVLAHAFIDLVDVHRVLLAIRKIAAQRAILYLTINFDGATIFEPTIEPEFDALVERLYHDTMDRRIVNGAPSGDSRTGRHLYHNLVQAGFNPSAVGASDWVVIPRGAAGGADRPDYPDDEAYFLHYLVDTVEHALAGHPLLPEDRFRAWIAQRHRQIEAGELVYVAHQLDYLATVAHNVPA